MSQEVGELFGALGVLILRSDVFMAPQWSKRSKQTTQYVYDLLHMQFKLLNTKKAAFALTAVRYV